MALRCRPTTIRSGEARRQRPTPSAEAGVRVKEASGLWEMRLGVEFDSSMTIYGVKVKGERR